MLRIRLQRTGNKNNPTFRLVVTEKSNAAKGKSMEFLGHYLPTRDPVVFEFDKARVELWISNGAAPTDTVARLLAKHDVKGMEKYIERYTKQKKRKEVEKKPETPAAPAEENKKEEAPIKDKQDSKDVNEAKEAKEDPTEEEKKEEVLEQEKKEEVNEEEKTEEPAEEKEDDKKEGDS